MAKTGYKNPDGTDQLECQVKKSFWCKIGIHWHRQRIDIGYKNHPCIVKRCIKCNHLKN